MNGYIKDYDGSKHLTLVLANEEGIDLIKNEGIRNKASFLIEISKTDSYDYGDNCLKFKTDSDDDLSLEKNENYKMW